tara:strand:+ start:83 stop:286 length:204 start_codon:yes stop_codon:yes gene_type:complete
MAKIQVNGKKTTVKANSSINDMLKKYKINSKKVAVELNGKIIPKSSYKNKVIKSDDKLEIVQFIGGG